MCYAVIKDVIYFAKVLSNTVKLKYVRYLCEVLSNIILLRSLSSNFLKLNLIFSSDGARTASVHVVRVYGCAHGRVTWERPHGGLEITFKSVVPVKTQGKYKVCVTTSKKNFNIFSRSKDKLQLLEGETNKTTLERCVSSHGRINTLYTEAPESGDSQSVVFQYRTTFLGIGHGALKQRECRSCSKKELIRSFCEDDFGK